MRSSLFLVLILKVKYEATLRDYPEQYVQECCEGPVEPTTTVGVAYTSSFFQTPWNRP
jgi:hypothetical protein